MPAAKSEIITSSHTSIFPWLGALLLLPLTGMLASYFAFRSVLLLIWLILAATAFLSLVRIRPESADVLFVLALSCISLCLLLSNALVSMNITGQDIHQEFYLFERVLETGQWQWNASTQELGTRYNSALSITILPSIVSIVSGVDAVSVFKFIFPIIFSLVPIILYKTYRKILTPQNAFISVFLVMAYPNYYTEMLGLARQQIAEVFLTLLVLMSLSFQTGKNYERRRTSQSIVMILLSLSIILAHYSIAYIFFILLIVSILAGRISPRNAKPLLDRETSLLWVVLAVGWYFFLAGGSSLLDAIHRIQGVTGGISDFFSLEARPTIVQEAIATNAGGGVLHLLSRVTQYAVVIGIILGVFALYVKRNKSDAEKKMLPLMATSVGLLIATVILPFFANLFNFSRFFHVALLFVAPCFAIGLEWADLSFRSIFRFRFPSSSLHLPTGKTIAAVAMVAVLSSYFLFTSGWVWAITMDKPVSAGTVFDWQRMRESPDTNIKIAYFDDYTPQQDRDAALWINSYGLMSRAVCADSDSKFHVLASYGEQDPNKNIVGYNTHELPYLFLCERTGDYVYLSTLNMVYGLGTSGYAVWPVSRIYGQVLTENRVYSGVAVIYMPET